MRRHPIWIRIAGAAALGGCALIGCFAYAAQQHVVTQKRSIFSAKQLSVKVGDTVKFVNEDSYSHNVFSLSEAKTFDLGSMPQGGDRSVTFDKPGTVEIECAVHTEMRMVIEVTK